ncbi:Ig-like domain-containing domain [Nitritalea halalkaliphila]|nr:Ig-like domain-containing domain [Nitritalea halalkaliphila]
MGGPKDETPPQLIRIKPENETRNVKPEVIELEFDEFVKLDNALKQIIITPRVKKDEMEITANRNRVLIKLNQELEDSTTYLFNFQKSIQDISEGNPAENLKLVFSTGPDIDSLTAEGNVRFIFPRNKMEDVLVGLYEVGDTTNVLTAPPYYVANADTSGNFRMTNLRPGKYMAYAWHDDNNSIKAEDKTEAYGFILDTIQIKENVKDLQFYISKADLSDFKITRAASSGSNFDIVLSKTPVKIELENEDIGKTLFYRLNEKTLRFYHTALQEDSTSMRLQFKDSVGFHIDTVLFAKFESSERRKEKLEVKTNSGKSFLKAFTAEINFNKPIAEIRLDSLLIQYDSASVIPVQKEWISFLDSAKRTDIRIDLSIIDTVSTTRNFKLSAADSTFLDVEGLFFEGKVEVNFKRSNPETLAERLGITYVTEKEGPFRYELLKKEEVIRHITTKEKTVAFTQVDPDTYQVRVIVDANENNRWDPSNFYEGRQAEEVFYAINPEAEKNKRDVILKAGWENNITITETPPLGWRPKAKEEAPKSVIEPILTPEQMDLKIQEWLENKVENPVDKQ